MVTKDADCQNYKLYGKPQIQLINIHSMRNFYGRRLGRRLSNEKQHLISNILPSLTIRPNNLIENKFINLSDCFAHQPEKLLLEIGYGQGEHLHYFAQTHLEWGLIGAEPFVNGTGILLKNIVELGLNNIRLWNDNINILIPHLQADSLDCIVILFPDPWPKLRHHKRRLIQKEFIQHCIRILKPQGKIILGTDHADYLQWIIDIIQVEKELVPTFKWNSIPKHKPYPWPLTTYESKACGQGRVGYYLEFILYNN